MIKVGIIGFGKMGNIRARAVDESGMAKVDIVFDKDSSKIEKKYNIAKTAEEVILNKDIEAVIICTPNYLNKPLTLQALSHGKSVFCEKPPAFTVKDIEEIMQVEKLSNKVLMYGFNHRHHESIKYIKHLIDSGEYGRIIWMRGRYGKSVDKSFFETWRSKKELAGGGILFDQGIHMLDLFMHLSGPFDEIKSFITNQYWHCDVEDNAFIIMKNKANGVVASLHSTMTQWRHLFSLEVFLEKGYMVMNGLKTSSGTYGEEILSIAKNRTTAPAATWEDEEKIIFDADQSWQSEIDSFLNGIIDNKPITNGNSKDAYNLMKMIERIYEDGKE